MNEAELLELKQEIADAKDKAAELTGKQTLLLEQLKEQYGVSTVKAGETKLKKLKKDIEAKELEIEEATDKLENQLQDEIS